RRAAAEDSDADDSICLAAVDTCTLAEYSNHRACPLPPDDLTVEQLQRIVRYMQDFKDPEHTIRPYREALATKATRQELHFRGANARLHLAS
ncbi:MAG: hypothetical protein ACKPKO_49745, partial [Candidatus Fonsibacter sp.]